MSLTKKSRKPVDGAFRQQQLPAWQPVLTPKSVLPTFFIVGVLFLPIGGLLYWSSTKVNEIMINYTFCDKYTQPIYLHPSLYKSRFSQDHVGEAPAFYYENVTQFLDTTWGNPNNLTIKRCTIDFTVPETMQGPIFMFYRLTNFNQNRRQYIKSYDPGQLAGQIVDPATLNSNCGPLAINENNLIYYPCGLIANSMFNDTASDLQSVTQPSIFYRFQRTNIAWPSDKQKYHPTTYSISSIVPPINWANRYPNGTYTQDYPPPDLSNMERLMIWMHVAALPDFRKLWARNDRESLASDRWRIQIDLNFDTTPYGGTKWLVISTTSPLGGKNPFLGIIYMTVGGIILLLGILFTLRHYLRPRKLADESFLYGNQGKINNKRRKEK